jgi:hypothetical protein
LVPQNPGQGKSRGAGSRFKERNTRNVIQPRFRHSLTSRRRHSKRADRAKKPTSLALSCIDQWFFDGMKPDGCRHHPRGERSGPLGRTGCAIAGSRRSCTQARPRGRKRTRWQGTKRYQASVDAVDRIIAFVAADRTGGTEDTIRGEARRKAGRTAVGLS